MSHRIIHYDGGTLVLEGFEPEWVPASFELDPRNALPRAPGIAYRALVTALHRGNVEYEDRARAYVSLEREHQTDRTPREYQWEAVDAWKKAGRRGVIVLPTGAGKSFVAELCLADASRSALFIAPTLDLVGQWYDQLRRAFGEPIGILGGGIHDVQDITVSTYDSAWIHVERYGNRFGLVVFDEVHHLPGPSYSVAAELMIAPYRLGLTATLERPDGAHERLDRLVGPVCYQKGIPDLAGEFLADYRTEQLLVHLSGEDRQRYEEHRACFRAFIDEKQIRLGGPGGWHQFLRQAARSKSGRQAFQSWRTSKKILEGAPAKIRLVEELLRRHIDGRIIIFTNDNATVYELSRLFLVPAITHQTNVKERRSILDDLAEGRIQAVVTSRVLNEGVDLPAADVAIVLSGTQTVREHVQRLGRILRRKEGKNAVLYELVVADSTEVRSSERRRAHEAYR